MNELNRTVWYEAARPDDSDARPHIHAVGLVLETPTRNRTWYPREVVEQAHAEMPVPFMGRDGHPPKSELAQGDRFQDSAVMWTHREIREALINGQRKPYVALRGRLLKTVGGQSIQEALDARYPVGVSIRGWAESAESRTIGDDHVKVPQGLTIQTYDLVQSPSSVGSRAQTESTTLHCFEAVDFRKEIAMSEHSEKPVPQTTSEEVKSEMAALQAQLAKMEERLQAQESVVTEAPALNDQMTQELRETAEKLYKQQSQTIRLYETTELVKRNMSDWIQQFPDYMHEKAEQDMRDQAELLLHRYLDLTPSQIWERAVKNITPVLAQWAAAQDLQRLGAKADRFREAVMKGQPLTSETAAATTPPSTNQRTGAGPVVEAMETGFEQRTGQPEWTRYSHDMMESFATDPGFRHEIKSKLNDKTHTELDWHPDAMRAHPNMAYVQEVLLHHDRIHGQDLINEYQKIHEKLNMPGRQKKGDTLAFWETVTSGDVATPSTTDRAIIMAALPMLVSTSVFDFGTVAGSEVKVPDEFRETFYSQTATTGTTTLTGNAAVGDTFQLDHQNLDADTGVTISGLDENTDFVVDYRNGILHFLTASSLGDATYAYRAYTGNENAAIQQSEWQTKLHTINISFTRLQTSLTREAIAYARADTGWDARTRNLFGLAFEIQEKIDKQNFQLAQTAARVAGHVATVGNASINLNTDEGLKQSRTAISNAKSLIEDDFYMANAIIGSVKSIELLADWEGFQRDGFPDGTLMANGVVTMHKGCRVVKTTMMDDDHLLITSPMSVRYRSLQGEMLKTSGPDRPVDTSTGRPKDVESWIVSCGDWAGFHRPERTAMVPLATS